MKKRNTGALIFLVLGLLILIVSSMAGWKSFLGFSIYSIPLVILGVAILLNKNEDKIERIRHLKIMRKDSREN
ncbi:MAG: hypothetical protein PF542_05940 [Nanoarchaeota archaeon]|jgi:peptidoglycan/LPS O-acetylase OafA/YrhL|nr:hypothetical protein [Nanoarchaeota archaeon]